MLLDGRIDAGPEVRSRGLAARPPGRRPILEGCGIQCLRRAFFRKGLFLEAEENLTLAIEMNQKTDFIAV